MITLKKITLSLFLWGLLVCSILSQDNITHYGITDGLADPHIKCLYQDTKGYLWIGTWEGISKFDGHHFTTFKHDPNDTTTIFNDEILQIAEDGTGRIWAYSKHGLMCYEVHRNSFQRVYLDHKHKGKILHSSPQSLLFDSNDLGWFITDHGLYRFSPDLAQIRNIDVSNVSYKHYNCILADSTGIWLLSYKGLFHFNFEALNKQAIVKADADRFFSFDVDLKEFIMHQIFKTANGRLVARFGQYGTIYIANEQTGKMELIVGQIIPGIDNRINELYEIMELEPGKLAFGAENSGIVIYDITSKQFLQNRPIQQFAKNQRINFTLRDKQQNIWFGGVNGLFKYEVPQLLFKQWLSGDEKGKSINGSFLMTIYADDKYVWLGTRDGGLQKMDRVSNHIERIRLPAKFQSFCNDSKAYYVYPYDKNRLLLNFDTSVFLYNKVNGRFKHLLNVKGHVYKFYKMEDESIWFTGGSKLFSLTLDTDLQDVKPIVEEKLQFSYFHRDILISENKNVFLAGREGLQMYDNTKLEHGEIIIPPGAETIPEVVCIHETDEGMLWLGTLRYGIYLFDPLSGEFLKHFDESTGLIDNSINVIYEDDQGLLWMSTWKGIACYDPESEQIENYSTANGLPFPEFNTVAHYRDENGTFYMGGIGGVISFHPDSLVRFNPEYHLQIVSVEARNENLPFNYPLGNDHLIELDYEQKDFTIAFSSFDFRNPEQRIYRYRLNGFDKNWIQAPSNQNVARFSDVSPGIYSLDVQSVYAGWPWAGEKTRLLIKIDAPPLFQRKSFQTGILIMLGVLLVSTIILRLRFVNVQKELVITQLERESNKSRLNFLKSQMNPHFYFNTLNAINSYILKNEIREANRFLTRFAKLMREILENSQQEFVEILQEVEVLDKYLSLQQLRFQDSFEYSIHIDPEVNDMLIPPMFLQPFLENSVEHAFKEMQEMGFVGLEFKLDGKEVLCSVWDTGIGIDSSIQQNNSKNRKSLAIQNIYKRLDMLNKIYNLAISIQIAKFNPQSKEYPGTLIKLRLPDFREFIGVKRIPKFGKWYKS